MRTCTGTVAACPARCTFPWQSLWAAAQPRTAGMPQTFAHHTSNKGPVELLGAHVVVLREQRCCPPLCVVHAAHGLDEGAAARARAGNRLHLAVLPVHAVAEAVGRGHVCELVVESVKKLRGMRQRAVDHVASCASKYASTPARRGGQWAEIIGHLRPE
jgi:hypothetical protein